MFTRIRLWLVITALLGTVLFAVACSDDDGDDDDNGGTTQPTVMATEPSDGGEPTEPAGEATEPPDGGDNGDVTLESLIDELPAPPDATIFDEGAYTDPIPYEDPTGTIDVASITDAEYRVYDWQGSVEGALLWFPNNIPGGLDEVYAGPNDSGTGQIGIWTLNDSPDHVLLVAAEEQDPSLASVSVVLGRLP
jgi:hypothetical protein